MVGATLSLMKPVNISVQKALCVTFIESGRVSEVAQKERRFCNTTLESGTAHCSSVPRLHCASHLARKERFSASANSRAKSALRSGHLRLSSHQSLRRRGCSGTRWSSEVLGFSRKHEARIRRLHCTASASSTPAASAESDVDEPDTDAPQTAQTSSAVVYESSPTLVPRPAGHVGFATFSGGSDSTPVVDAKLKPNAWWLLGPILLVTSIVIPHVIVPYVLELVFDNVIITDFLAYFLMDAFFLAGAAYFLHIADRFERQRRAALGQVAAWKMPWTKDTIAAGISGWAKFIMTASFGLPLVSMILVWSFGTGPASLAALGPYLCGIFVQQVAEKEVAKSGSPVWPMVPILSTVYRLHQLNRGSQLVLELLDSISVPDPSREVLAAAGSLEAVLRVLNILGILWLCNLAVLVFIMPALYSNWTGGPKPPERPAVWVPEAAPSS